jgi:hypothetical protein
VARREAFVPTLFANKGQQPIALKQPYDVLADAAKPPELWDVVLAGRNTPKVLQRYDFLAVTGGKPPILPPTPCLRPFFGQSTFEIYRILHDAGCGSPAG